MMGQVGIDLNLVGTRFRVAGQRRGQRLRQARLLAREFAPEVDRRASAGFGQLLPDRAQFR